MILFDSSKLVIYLYSIVIVLLIYNEQYLSSKGSSGDAPRNVRSRVGLFNHLRDIWQMKQLKRDTPKWQHVTTKKTDGVIFKEI